MSDLVRVRINGYDKNVGAAFAKNKELEVLDDEPTHLPDGRVRGMTRASGRPMKARTSVAKKAAEKKAASADQQKADAKPAQTAEEASK